MKNILDWMVNSTYFKKHAAIIGTAALMHLLDMRYWQQMAATRAAWGLDKGTVEQWLLAVIAASGIAASYGLSIAKAASDKQELQK